MQAGCEPVVDLVLTSRSPRPGLGAVISPSTGPKYSVRWNSDPAARRRGRPGDQSAPVSSSWRAPPATARPARASSAPAAACPRQARSAGPSGSSGPTDSRPDSELTASTSWRRNRSSARPSRPGSPATRPSTSGRRGRRRSTTTSLTARSRSALRGDDDRVLAAGLGQQRQVGAEGAEQLGGLVGAGEDHALDPRVGDRAAAQRRPRRRARAAAHPAGRRPPRAPRPAPRRSGGPGWPA